LERSTFGGDCESDFLGPFIMDTDIRKSQTGSQTVVREPHQESTPTPPRERHELTPFIKPLTTLYSIFTFTSFDDNMSVYITADAIIDLELAGVPLTIEALQVSRSFVALIAPVLSSSLDAYIFVRIVGVILRSMMREAISWADFGNTAI
jgi:hypothetical protein